MKGSPMQRNFGIGSPARAKGGTTTGEPDFSGNEKKTKSKDPIGDWLRKAGKQLKSDLGTLKSKVETGAQKLTSKVASDVSELAKTDVPKKFVSDVSNLVTKVKSKIPKSKKSETHKRVLKNPFNVGQGYKWVKK